MCVNAGLGSTVNRTLADILLRVLGRELGAWSHVRLIDYGFTPYFSYALSEDGFLGVAYNPGGACSRCFEAGETVFELASLAWLGSVETSLALAAFSTATQAWIHEDPGRVEMPAPPVDQWAPRLGGEALLVGYMRGVGEELEKLGYKVRVVEDNPILRREAEEKGFETYPGSYIYMLRPRLIVASGASLLDPRLYFYMKSLGEPYAILLGPTATIHPEAARLLGFTCVGGSYIDPGKTDRALRLLKLGAGYHELRRRGLIDKWVKCF